MIVDALPSIIEGGKFVLGLTLGTMGKVLDGFLRLTFGAGVVIVDTLFTAGQKIWENLPDLSNASKEGWGSFLDTLFDIIFNDPDVTGPNTDGALLGGAFGEDSNMEKLYTLLNSFFNDGYSVGDLLGALPFAGEDAIKSFLDYFNEKEPEPTEPSDGEEDEENGDDEDDEQNGDDEDDETGEYDEIVFNGNEFNSLIPSSNLLCEPLLAEASNLGYSYTDLEKLSMMAIPPGMLKNVNGDIALPNGLFSDGSRSSASSLSLTLEAGVCCAAVSYCAQSMGVSMDLTGFNMNTNTFGGNSNPSTQTSSSSTTSSSTTTTTTGHTSTSTTTILFTN